MIFLNVIIFEWVVFLGGINEPVDQLLFFGRLGLYRGLKFGLSVLRGSYFNGWNEYLLMEKHLLLLKVRIVIFVKRLF